MVHLRLAGILWRPATYPSWRSVARLTRIGGQQVFKRHSSCICNINRSEAPQSLISDPAASRQHVDGQSVDPRIQKGVSWQRRNFRAISDLMKTCGVAHILETEVAGEADEATV